MGNKVNLGDLKWIMILGMKSRQCLRKDWIPKSNPRLRSIKGNILGIDNWPRKKWKLVSYFVNVFIQLNHICCKSIKQVK